MLWPNRWWVCTKPSACATTARSEAWTSWSWPPPTGCGGSTTAGSTGRSDMFRRSSSKPPTTPRWRPDMYRVAVPPSPIMCRCSAWSRSFVLARKQRGLRALHLDHSCAPAELAAIEERSRINNLGDQPKSPGNRVSIKLGVVHLGRADAPRCRQSKPTFLWVVKGRPRTRSGPRQVRKSRQEHFRHVSAVLGRLFGTLAPAAS
jgi:hypothetical protein